MVYVTVCCNHMLPGGASLVHPHLQVFGGETVPWQVKLYWDRSAAWFDEHRESYWQTLVDQEQAAGERYVWGADGVHWLVPFAPAGAREALAVVPGAARLTDLGDEHVAASAGSSRGTRTKVSLLSTSRCRAGLCVGARTGSPSSRASSPAPPSSRTTAPMTTSCRSSSAVS
jgi:galactose-1-phosphate uridylyltransferase